MRIGIPRETKEGERRVALLPGEVAELARQGRELVVERGAGAGAGVEDAAYVRAGARLSGASEAWSADLVVKVKEVQDGEWRHVPDEAAIFSFHQLPGEPHRTREFARRGITAIGFEMLRDEAGGYPLLAPMSRIAGRMAVEAAARALGHAPGRVLVIGAGNAGFAAARKSAELGARVTVLTRSEASADRAREAGFDAGLASAASIEALAPEADLVVGAVWVPGARTPRLLPRALVARMRRGAVIADVCIDGGGIAETSRTTTHAEPTFVEEGVIHYGIPNIPAAAPAEAAAALSAAVLPYVARIAGDGVDQALRGDRALREATLVWHGRVRHPGIAAEAGLPYTSGLP